MFVITVLVAVSIGVTDPFFAECRLWFTTQATGAEAAAAPSAGLAMLTGPGKVTAANASATPEIKPIPCLIMVSPWRGVDCRVACSYPAPPDGKS